MANNKENFLKIIEQIKKGSVRKIGLCNEHLEDSECKLLFSVLAENARKAESPVSELDLSYTNISEKSFSLLCEHLRQPFCKIIDLNLSFFRLPYKLFKILCSALNVNQSLRELDLSYIGIDDAKMELLARWLKKNPLLLILNIEGAFCNDASLLSLANAVAFNFNLACCFFDKPHLAMHQAKWQPKQKDNAQFAYQAIKKYTNRNATKYLPENYERVKKEQAKLQYRPELANVQFRRERTNSTSLSNVTEETRTSILKNSNSTPLANVTEETRALIKQTRV